MNTNIPAKTSKISFAHVNPFLNWFYVILQDYWGWIAQQQAMNTRKALTFGCKFGLMIINTELIHFELS
jgi:hypothetical protein